MKKYTDFVSETTLVIMDIVEIYSQWGYHGVALRCHGTRDHQQIF